MINIFWPKFDRSGVSDQLNLLEDIFNSRNIPYVISDRLCPYATNILIEEFNKKKAKYVQDFCALHQISIFVLVTEFLHVKDNHYFVNDIPENIDLVNLPSNLFLQRFYYLNKLNRCIQGFISLLDLPSLEPYCNLFNVDDSYRIGIPDKKLEIEKFNARLEYDFYFSGSLTPYRLEIIELLSKTHKIYYEKTFVPESLRVKNLLNCRYLLNIPQSKDWKWVSVMRVYFGLRFQKMTIHYGEAMPNILTKYIATYAQFVQGGHKTDNVESASLIDDTWKNSQEQFFDLVISKVY